MDINECFIRARLAFIAAHDGYTPRAARVPVSMADELRQQLALDGDYMPVDGRFMFGMTLVEDANVSVLTIE